VHRRRALILALIIGAFCPAAWAQSFPAKPVKLIVPFAAGGAADLFARTLANGMSNELGQQRQNGGFHSHGHKLSLADSLAGLHHGPSSDRDMHEFRGGSGNQYGQIRPRTAHRLGLENVRQR
jgi:hypothetical protein